MRHLLQPVAIAAVCALLSWQPIDARGRNNNTNGGGERTHQTSPQQSRSRGGGQTHRPQPKKQDIKAPAQRPGNNDRGNNRPGNNVAPGHNRPGNNFGPGNQRPPQQAMRPPQNLRPGAPAPPPGRPQDWGRPHGIHFGAPYRPMMPAHRPWAPPLRPAGLHVAHGPVINTILGVAIGTALGITLNTLVNQGYNVTGYVDNAVYVADAMQLNMLWPNATLYYDNGGLSASEFFYSTPFYDMGRYNSVYTRLVNTYGAPYSVRNLAGGGMDTMWWGPGGQFIQLQFNTGVASNGTTRYFTTLSFGN